MKYHEGSSVSEHLSQFQDCVNRLCIMKLALDEELQALILLSSLLDSWETLVVSLSSSAPNGTVTLTMVKDSMLNEEMRRRELGITNESSALVTENRGRSPYNNSYNNDRNDKSKTRSKSRKGITCHYYHKPNHKIAECRKLIEKGKRDQSKLRSDENGKDNVAAVTCDGDLIIACYDDFVNFTSHDSTWVVDSAALFHVTSQRDLFTFYKQE